MVRSIYTRTLNILSTLPFKLWGLSLLSGLLSIIVMIFGFLPIITIPVIAVLNAGMVAVYFAAYNGHDVSSKMLFSGYKNFGHIAGGMCWRTLWIVLWALIPIAGPFIAIYKSYQYAFTPYILNEEKEVDALDALKKSMQDTNGYKLQMFIASIIPAAIYFVVSLVLSLFGLIPFVGVFFRVVSSIISIAYSLVAPMFFGLVEAGFYEYGKKPVRASAPQPQPQPTQPATDSTTPNEIYTAPTVTAAPAETATEETAALEMVQPAPANICSVCGYENTPDKKFCTKCGAKL